GRAAQVLPDSNPVTARAREHHVAPGGERELETVRVEKGLVTTAVLSPPDVLEPREDRWVNHRIEDDRDVEGTSLARGRPDKERVGDPVPPSLARAVEVYVDLRIEEGMEPVTRVERVDPGLPAVTEDGHEPIVG